MPQCLTLVSLDSVASVVRSDNAGGFAAGFLITQSWELCFSAGKSSLGHLVILPGFQMRIVGNLNSVGGPIWSRWWISWWIWFYSYCLFLSGGSSWIWWCTRADPCESQQGFKNWETFKFPMKKNQKGREKTCFNADGVCRCQKLADWCLHLSKSKSRGILWINWNFHISSVSKTAFLILFIHFKNFPKHTFLWLYTHIHLLKRLIIAVIVFSVKV